jgi:hypothetical protein
VNVERGKWRKWKQNWDEVFMDEVKREGGERERRKKRK